MASIFNLQFTETDRAVLRGSLQSIKGINGIMKEHQMVWQPLIFFYFR